jgi:hypothetical protein
VSPLVSDALAPRGDALLAKLAELVAGRLGSEVEFVGTGVSLDEARSRAGDVDGFLYVEVSIARGQLQLIADAHRVPRSVWARARSTKPGPVAHAQAHAPIDAEVRAYLDPLGFEAKPHVARYTEADAEILALACGDLNGDGASELVTMTRSRVVTVRLVDGKVVPQLEARWDARAPIAPVPLREPFAMATIVRAQDSDSAYLDLALTDRAGSVRLDHELKVVARFPLMAVPHAGATACSRMSNLLLSRGRERCSAAEPEPWSLPLTHDTDTLASAWLVTAEGAEQPVVVSRRESMLMVSGLGGVQPIARVGAQLAVGDVDQDGAPEVMSTSDTLAPSYDALEVHTVLPRGKLQRRLKLSAPGGVRAVAVCPPDGPGPAPMVVATGTEIWVVR